MDALSLGPSNMVKSFSQKKKQYGEITRGDLFPKVLPPHLFPTLVPPQIKINRTR
jgi:hypothetical protein